MYCALRLRVGVRIDEPESFIIPRGSYNRKEEIICIQVQYYRVSLIMERELLITHVCLCIMCKVNAQTTQKGWDSDSSDRCIQRKLHPFSHKHCIISPKQSPFSTTLLFIHSLKCNTIFLFFYFQLASWRSTIKRGETTDTAVTESDVTFLHAQGAALL